MEISKFRTMQEIVPAENPSVDGCWIMGIDAGYSGLKGFAPNKRFCFPSAVKKIGDRIPTNDSREILYKDETGIYVIGTLAQEQIAIGDTSETQAELFNRNRYKSPKFLAVVRTGIALGMMEANGMKPNPKLPIKIQTGLPTEYLDDKDEKAIKEAFSKPGTYYIKVGTSRNWMQCEWNLTPEDISVTAQPKGTLYSILIENDGTYAKDAMSILKQRVLIVDAGFGTFDPYGLFNGNVVLKESIPNIGMKKVLEETSDALYQEYREKIRIEALQKYLTDGIYPVLDEETMTTKDVDLRPYVKKANEKVCLDSIAQLKTMTNYLRDYDILVMTGGTGSAWYDMYADHFKGMKHLKVMPGNRLDSLPMQYSNVRGYYMVQYIALKNRKST